MIPSVAVLKPNEAAFEKEIEGMPSTRSVGDLPPEFHCPLCTNVMKDAVLTSKCCFTSFCDKCIRDHIISKSICVCGKTNILADDLLPNKTLRDTINRILESGNSSTENAGSTFQIQDMESARCPQPKIPSPASSAASKGELKISPVNVGVENIHDTADERKAVSAPQQTSEKANIPRPADVSEATRESMSVKEPALQGSTQVVEEEVQQKLVPAEAGKKKKKKKVRMPANDLQWKTPHDFGTDNYMMPMAPPPGYNPYWNGMQPCVDGFMAPYAAPMQMMGYGLGPLDMPFAGGLPQDPFGMQGYMMPGFPPHSHRDLAAEFSMGMNAPPPVMSREEFEARKADLRRKRENERRGERDMSKDREFGREVSSFGDVSSVKSKTKSIPPPLGSDYYQPQQRHQRLERPSPERSPRKADPPRPAKRKPEQHPDRERDQRDRDYEQERHHHRRHHRSESLSRRSSEPMTKSSSSNAAAAEAAAAEDWKQKSSVFSRIRFASEEEVAAKKRKKSTTEAATASGSGSASAHHLNGYYQSRKSNAAMADYESSDDDERHFKRRPSRYEPSPPPKTTADWEEEGRHSRGSRERRNR